MKIQKLLILAIFTLIAFLSIGNPVFAATERIDNFDATIKMNADASIDVTEQIDYNFGALQKHGFYRDIPVKYQARGGSYSLRISDISVADETGAAYDFAVSDKGSDKEIKIGNADVLVTGSKVYVIRYKIKRAINYFDDHDELYWNATGNEWTVPIVEASAHVIFPSILKKENAQIKCFSGSLGSTISCDSAQYVYREDALLVSGADFSANNLRVGEGLTVVSGIPKGILYKPTPFESFSDTLKDNWLLLLPFFVFALMFYLWWTRGRDPKGRGTIIPEFDVPDNLSPAEVGTIVDEKCGQKEIVGEIVNLAVKGYLKIRREETKTLFMKSADYTFEKLREPSGLANKYEVAMMDGIFRDGKTVKLSDLKGTFFNDYNAVVKDVYQSVYEKGYFSDNPSEVIAKYTAVALFALIAMFIAGNYNAWGDYGFLGLVLSVIIVFVFSQFMPQKTYQGVITKEYILGLKDYLTVAEKDRLEFHNAPEKNPRQFEQLLPYAIALGVEKEWAKQFEGIYNANPSWYEDSRGFNNFNAVYFASSLGDFKTNFTSAAVPASSGGSGFGGGGFSGGGFGGGGGGSW